MVEILNAIYEQDFLDCSSSVFARDHTTTSISRYLVRSALLPSGPCPGTILVLLSA